MVYFARLKCKHFSHKMTSLGWWWCWGGGVNGALPLIRGRFNCVLISVTGGERDMAFSLVFRSSFYEVFLCKCAGTFLGHSPTRERDRTRTHFIIVLFSDVQYFFSPPSER